MSNPLKLLTNDNLNEILLQNQPKFLIDFIIFEESCKKIFRKYKMSKFLVGFQDFRKTGQTASRFRPARDAGQFMVSGLSRQNREGWQP